jgi:hypothetical protein
VQGLESCLLHRYLSYGREEYVQSMNDAYVDAKIPSLVRSEKVGCRKPHLVAGAASKSAPGICHMLIFALYLLIGPHHFCANQRPALLH